ncbi:MAG: ABC transporter permease [Coriobacteriia bacterium]|nr:ABC transporter permease [Coriobacteriia bacterium]
MSGGLDPRWRKVARDLLAHKLRTVLVVASIAVGIFAILVVMGGRGILLQTFDDNLPKSNPSNATLYTTPFGEELVDRVRRAEGVREAEGRRTANLRFREGDVSANEDPPAEITQIDRAQAIGLYAAQDWTLQRLELVFPDAGTTWPPRAGEIVLESSDRQVTGLVAGDLMTIDTRDGKKKVLRVAGYAHDINGFPALFTGQLYGFVSMETMADLGEPSGMNQLLVSLDGVGLDRAAASRVVSRIRDDVVAPTGVTVLASSVPEPGSHRLGDIFKAVSVLLLALGVLALLLSGFLVVNTISALLTQQTKQLGIMKAIGARANQIRWMYLAMVAIYGVLAILVGLPIGAYWASWFSGFAGGLLNFGPGSLVPPAYAIMLAIGVGIVVPLAAAWLPVRAGTRMSVVKALNDTGMGGARFGHGWTDRVLGSIRGLPRPVALGLRNTFLRKGRLAMTLATLILASAVVMGVGSVRSSILRTVADVGTWWNYDVEVGFAQPVNAKAAEREAMKVGGATGTEGWVVSSAALKRGDGSENEQLAIIGLPPATTFIVPQIVEGRWLREGDRDAVVVNTDVVKGEKLAVGETVTLKIRGGDHEFKIVGVARGQMMGPVFFTDRTYLEGALGLQGSIMRLLVRQSSHTMADQDSAADRLERRFRDAGMAVASVEGQQRMSTNFANQLGILVTFLVIMAVILAAVGVIGLTGTMIINVLESTREIGVMRAVGASHLSIFQVFIAEGVTIGLISWLVGAVLSYPLSLALVGMLEGAIGIPLSFAFSWEAVGMWLVVVTAISALASLLPAFNASQVSVRDAIAYE